VVRPRFLFVGSVLPHWGTQSGPVLFRHLVRLSKKYEVICVFFGGDIPADYPLATLRIPTRMKFWLPHRDRVPGSRYVRDILITNYIERTIGIRRDDKICVCLHTREHIIARKLSKDHNVPFYCILHDIWPEAFHNEIVRSLQQAESILCVSQRLLDLCKGLGASGGAVMLPIGEEFIKDVHLNPPKGCLKIGIAGSLDLRYVELGRCLADELVVVGFGDAIDRNKCNIRVISRFAVNRDALLFLAENCNALLVYIPFEIDAAYGKYGFPSRLIDFAQTGLPLIICAPRESNLGQWGEQNDWTLWLTDPNNIEELNAIRSRLYDQETWQAEAFKTRKIAMTQFNPEIIQSKFESNICN
jgi:hypothetical protein